MNIITIALRAVTEIQVGGDKCFDGKRWREAILYYLFGVWADRQEVMHRPKLNFGFDNATLRFDSDNHQYFAYRNGEDHLVRVPLEYLASSDALAVRNGQEEVEQGLIRFVKNNRIRVLGIRLGEFGGFVWLIKGTSRGELFLSSQYLPTAEQYLPRQ